MTAAQDNGKLAVLLAGLGGLGTMCMVEWLLAEKSGSKPPLFASLPLADADMAMAAGLRPALEPALAQEAVFGGWDVFKEDFYVATALAGIVTEAELAAVESELRGMRPMKAVSYREYPRDRFGTFVKKIAGKAEAVDAVEQDIRGFLDQTGASRAVAVWCGTPENVPAMARHETIADFEEGLRTSDLSITNSQIYAWACVRQGTPFLSVAANGSVRFPAVQQLAIARGTPIAGEGFAVCPTPIPEAGPTPALMASKVEITRRNAPLLRDVVLLLDLARRRGLAGLQDWMQVYFGPPDQTATRWQRALEVLPSLAGDSRGPVVA